MKMVQFEVQFFIAEGPRDARTHFPGDLPSQSEHAKNVEMLKSIKIH